MLWQSNISSYTYLHWSMVTRNARLQYGLEAPWCGRSQFEIEGPYHSMIFVFLDLATVWPLERYYNDFKTATEARNPLSALCSLMHKETPILYFTSEIQPPGTAQRRSQSIQPPTRLSASCIVLPELLIRPVHIQIHEDDQADAGD
jgi:hypothetical protein